ncbi:hypothetical protein ACX80E_08345 [Arthrobacter sp. TMN-49]
MSTTESGFGVGFGVGDGDGTGALVGALVVGAEVAEVGAVVAGALLLLTTAGWFGVVLLSILGMMKNANNPMHNATTPKIIKGISERLWNSMDVR